MSQKQIQSGGDVATLNASQQSHTKLRREFAVQIVGGLVATHQWRALLQNEKLADQVWRFADDLARAEPLPFRGEQPKPASVN